MPVKRQTYIILFFSFVLLLSTNFAQTFSVSGKVTDEDGEPVVGVNIIVFGTDYGSSTDENGYYQISNLSPGDFRIEFSAIGFEKYVVDIVSITNKSMIINAALKETIIQSDEVLITAGKYEQKKSDLPVSTEIISGVEFIESNFSNLEDALRYVPGVNMTEDQISIRGSSGYSRGAGSRALLAIDGLTFHTGDTGETVWEMIPVTELQRVEIIKGAASSLYGSSAIGGVINGLTKDISPKPLTTVNGFYGLYDKPYHSQWDWSGEMRPFNGLTLSHSNSVGKFGFSASFTRLEDLSYRQDDFFKKYIGFIKARYNFSPLSSITLLANTFNKRSGNFLYWKDSRNALVPPEANRNERIETNRYLFGLIYNSFLNNGLYLNVKTSYYRNHFKDSGTASNESTSNLYRGELQLTANLTNNIILTSGVEGNNSTVKSNLFGNPNSFGFGAYSVTDVTFNFPLIASLGIRYDYTKLDSLDGEGAISPKLGLNYKLLNNLIVRASVGTGFRAPTLAEAFTSTSTSGITVKPNPKIKSESNLTFEVGVNYLPLDFLNIDAAVFQNEYYNMIEPGIDPFDGQAVFENVLRARIQGFETNTIVEFFPDQLSLTFSYTYMSARDLENNITLKYRPRHLIYSSLDFTKWNFDLGIDFRYWSKIEEIDDELIDLGIVRDGEQRVPVYVTDFRAGYNLISAGLPLRIFINVKNLFNYNYVELIGNIRKIRSYSFGFNLAI
ncbi:MAG: TonB-dependent receptor [Ignavibacteriaceae bacterium]|nr:TonB-dependent receptor [Ignavibacteria bacterium]MBT8390904.1 TonB-dependent receptor [Ignavibacteria bacterium]NNJ54263.1 TonB-dependent receptor [Ignavibacteriaceae bacterium]